MNANLKLERKAINLVKKYEKRKGRNPKEVKNKGYDIYSSGLHIEVKASKGSNRRIFSINYSNINAFEKDSKFRLYIVRSPNYRPCLTIMSKNTITNRKKARRLWILRFKKEDFDKEIEL